MESLLIVEDNQDVNQMLREALQSAGFTVDSAYTGLEGLRKIKMGEYHLVLLDLMLPYKSGDEILKEVRECSDIPVLILSAKDMIGTKVDLLKLGADDYITKPFDLTEVVARVETNLRRFRKNALGQNIVSHKDMTLNVTSKRVTVSKKEVELTAKEFMILELLMKYKEKVFTKANLYETIWEEDYLGDENAIKTHISNLRNKLRKANPDEKYIETVWGIGYRLYRE